MIWQEALIRLKCTGWEKKRMCYNFHSSYRWFLSLDNAKLPKVGLQWIPLTTDAAHTSIWLFGAFFDVFDHAISRYLEQWFQSYSYWKPSTISGENLRSIRLQMLSQGHLTSTRNQKVLYWKPVRDFHVGSNGPIYIFYLFFCF